MSESLARLGHDVDIVLPLDEAELRVGPHLRYVASDRVFWPDYDVVKTLFHGGFEFLERLGGADHPFIISKLGSVVGSQDDQPGVYFYGNVRKKLFAVQQRIARKSRLITILTPESAELWGREHARSEDILLLPTGVDAVLPDTVKNPYLGFEEKIVVYIGNLYRMHSGQRRVNILWQNRLSAIGRLLRERGIRLVVIGPGESDFLDTEAVTFLGPVGNPAVYAYMQHADAGLVLAQGTVQHNESSKLYEYLRWGLPVVSEAPVPNNWLIHATGLGYIADFMDDEQCCELLTRAAHEEWRTAGPMTYMIQEHAWDKRAAVYDELIPPVV